MSGWNGSGVFSFPYNWEQDAQNGIAIRADRMDSQFFIISTNGFQNTLTRDGQGYATANLPMNGFKHTGAAAGTNTGDYATFEQLPTAGTYATLGANTFTGAQAIANTTAVSGANGDITVVNNAANNNRATIYLRGSTLDGYFISAGSGDNVRLGTPNNGALELDTNAVARLTISASGNVTIAQSLTVTGTVAASNFSGASSGTNTGDQTITLSGVVTGSGTGAITTSLNGQINGSNGALTDAATIAWNANTAQTATLTIAGNRTLALPTNLVAGGTYLIRITQGSGGSHTLAYASGYKWAGGTPPVLSTAAGAIDMISFSSDGTNMFGSNILKAFS